MQLSGFAREVADYSFGVLAPEYDLPPRLAEISAPALVVVGSYDGVCPPVASRALAAGIPDARFVDFPEAGYFAFSEVPDAFQEVVRTLLKARLNPPPLVDSGSRRLGPTKDPATAWLSEKS
jgi:pimeloyl-ACP methyl ester carboxylesterase